MAARSLAAGLFAFTLFVAATLLFSAQPMIARMVLPELGGSPSVWTTCMLFFQVALLAAYSYAHILGSRLSPRVQIATHACLFLAAWVALPIEISATRTAGLSNRLDPAVGLLWLLAGSVGLPFFAVATSAPLLQRWFAGPDPSAKRDPYFLYAASNAGSLAALLSYPLWVERQFGLARQSALWGAGFVGLAGLILACGVSTLWVRRDRDVTRTEPAKAPSIPPKTWLGWVTLSFIPSSLLLGVTSYITTDLAAIPLLWVIPLALYLLSFILVFGRRPDAPGRFWSRAFPLLLMPLAVAIGVGLVQPFWVPLHLLTFFAAAMVCHGRLARGRPEASALTSFYLAMALGGAIGGVFNAVVAPIVFDRVAEYPLALVAACLVLGFRDGKPEQFRWGDLAMPLDVGLLASALCANLGGLADNGLGVAATIFAAGLTMLVAYTHRQRPVRFALTVGALWIASGFAEGVTGKVLVRDRGFFGVLKVTEVDGAGGKTHRLFHGSTLHGQQSFEPGRSREPLTYFDRSGPIGQVFDGFDAKPASEQGRVAVTGVGAGSLASYARAGQSWTFYEIDPAVVRVARDPRFFSYLTDCRASRLEFPIGDARVELARAPDHAFDLLILDAFSSDAIPAHLLTRESLSLYRRKLVEGGWLVFNISNRYLDLAPVVALLASDAGLACRVRVDADVTPAEKLAGKQGSIWAVMAARAEELGALATDPRWVTPRAETGDEVWTDDHSNITRHLRFRRPKTTAIVAPAAKF